MAALILYSEKHYTITRMAFIADEELTLRRLWLHAVYFYNSFRKSICKQNYWIYTESLVSKERGREREHKCTCPFANLLSLIGHRYSLSRSYVRDAR